MACQCGCCDTPAPEGSNAQPVPEKSDLEHRVEELDRRVKELETAA